MTELSRDFVGIELENRVSYGGNQRLWPEGNMRFCGCGVIAAADLLLYMSLTRPQCRRALCPGDKRALSFQEYRALAETLNKKFLPLIPRRGINGLGLAAGLNWCFKKYKLPMRCSWQISRGKLWQGLEDMLSRDIPVIFAIGPNFPKVWQKHALPLYKKREDGSLVRSGSVKAHYVSVTGMDGTHLRISSWGEEYYISREEYMEYLRRHSCAIVCNYLRVREL